MVSALRSLSSRHHPVARATQPHRARVPACSGKAPYDASTTGQVNYTSHNTPKTSANTSHFSGCGYDGAQGEVLDQWYFRARYFDSELGRFISRDPLGYVDGMSMYRAYFAPRALDPSGRNEIVIGPPIYTEITYPRTLEEWAEAENERRRIIEASRIQQPVHGTSTLGGGGSRGSYTQGSSSSAKCYYRTDEQKGSPVPNGCGPENGFERHLIFNNPLFIFPFGSSCDAHDICYGTCGASRDECDKKFLQDMLNVCQAYRGRNWLSDYAARRCEALANTYYLAVSKLGEGPYQSGQDQHCKWNEYCCSDGCPEGRRCKMR